MTQAAGVSRWVGWLRRTAPGGGLRSWRGWAAVRSAVVRGAGRDGGKVDWVEGGAGAEPLPCAGYSARPMDCGTRHRPGVEAFFPYKQRTSEPMMLMEFIRVNPRQGNQGLVNCTSSTT